MSTCAACRNTRTERVTFHRFPQEEERWDLWMLNMRRSGEAPALCSEHFTPECFDASGRLQPDAVPTVFTSQQVKDPDVEEGAGPQAPPPCGCERRVALMEKSYRLKLLTLQLQVKKYQMELNEQSRHTARLRRKVMVLQAAAKVLSMRNTPAPQRSAPAPPEHI